MDPNDQETAAARCTQGPIVAVKPADVRKLWEAYRQLQPVPNWEQRAIGVSVLGFGGMDPAQFEPIWMRTNMLHALVQRGILKDYQTGDGLQDGVFQATATMPCDMDDLAEAMIQMRLAQSSGEEVAQAKQEMLETIGYDITQPKIDGKFLAWLREHSA